MLQLSKMTHRALVLHEVEGLLQIAHVDAVAHDLQAGHEVGQPARTSEAS